MVGGVYGFVYLYVLVAAYRWHLEGKRDFRPGPMIAVAVLFSTAAWAFAGKQVGVSKYNFVTDSLRLPVVLVGMGVFLLFQRREFHSRVVNAVAGSAFAAHLITDYQPSQKLLWQTWLDLGGLMSVQGFFVALGALGPAIGNSHYASYPTSPLTLRRTDGRRGRGSHCLRRRDSHQWQALRAVCGLLSAKLGD